MKYYLIKTEDNDKIIIDNQKDFNAYKANTIDNSMVELTVEDLRAIWYSITNTCEVFGQELPRIVDKIRKVLE